MEVEQLKNRAGEIRDAVARVTGGEHASADVKLFVQAAINLISKLLESGYTLERLEAEAGADADEGQCAIV